LIARSRTTVRSAVPSVSSTTTAETPPRSRRTAATRRPSGDQRGSAHCVSGCAAVSGAIARPSARHAHEPRRAAERLHGDDAPVEPRVGVREARPAGEAALAAPLGAEAEPARRVRLHPQVAAHGERVDVVLLREQQAAAGECTLGERELRRPTRRTRPSVVTRNAPATSPGTTPPTTSDAESSQRGYSSAHAAPVSSRHGAAPPAAPPAGRGAVRATESLHARHALVSDTPNVRRAAQSKRHGMSCPLVKSTKLRTLSAPRSRASQSTSSEPYAYACCPPGNADVASDHSSTRGTPPSSALARASIRCCVLTSRPAPVRRDS
jgi:hypothetical protein